MTELHAVFLGILQGVTEFLPISSSGHLVLAEHFMNIEIGAKEMFGMNIIFHAGTLFALMAVYFREWIKIIFSPFRKDKKNQKLFLHLIIASIPAGVVGILFEDAIADKFSSVTSVAIAFLCTAFILWISEFISSKGVHKEQTFLSAIYIGIAQSLALIPGLSRSGLTISAGRMVGMRREDALDFSFLMACPVIAGATLLTLFSAGNADLISIGNGIFAIGFISSMITSFVSIVFLRGFVKKYCLSWFGLYLVFIAAILLLV